MKIKYISLIFIVILSFMYTRKVYDYSKINNTLLTSIEKFSQENNQYCIEGKINELGIILSFDGKIVDKNKSFSNMKGNIFNEELLNPQNNKEVIYVEYYLLYSSYNPPFFVFTLIVLQHRLF